MKLKRHPNLHLKGVPVQMKSVVVEAVVVAMKSVVTHKGEAVNRMLHNDNRNQQMIVRGARIHVSRTVRKVVVENRIIAINPDAISSHVTRQLKIRIKI